MAEKINETIFINLYSRGKDSTMIRKGLFWFSAHSLWSRMREEEEWKPWKICGVILESSQFIVRRWFSSFSFEQTNIKICFCIFAFMKMISFFRKVRARFLPIFPYLLPEWDRRFIVVRLRYGKVSLFGSGVLFSRVILCIKCLS